MAPNTRPRSSPFAGGHTPSDLCLLLPDVGIAFAGDLLAVQVYPMLRGGDPETWYDILGRLAVSNYYTFAPGHGDIGTRQDILDQQRYVTAVQHLVDAMRAASTIAATSTVWLVREASIAAKTMATLLMLSSITASGAGPPSSQVTN